MLSNKEIAQELENYLNEKGLWGDFQDWIESKGYKLAEFGLPEDE